MNRGRGLFTLILSVLMVFSAGLAAIAAAKVPEGYRDIKLGMNKGQVLEILEKNRTHFSYDDVGQEIREIVRGDDLFRHATYVFNQESVLVEIGLEMREILGRERVLQLFNRQHGIDVSPRQRIVEADTSIEVHNNTLLLKKAQDPDKRSAKRPK